MNDYSARKNLLSILGLINNPEWFRHFILSKLRRRQGRDREEEEDTQLDPNLPGQEEVHEEEKLQNDQEIDQEVEVTTEVVQPQRTVLLNFQPINPDNICTDKNEQELNLEQYFP